MTHPLPADLSDPVAFAAAIRLQHVSTDDEGIRRVRRGQGWSFHAPDGSLLQGPERERLLALAVPPAWQDVWLCPHPDGHVQAEGTDDAGRRQRRYHDRWTEGRRMMNFDRLRLIGPRLGPVRRQVERELDSDDPVRRATAVMIRLADRAMARIGSQRSARELGHYGVSTLLPQHIDIDGEALHLSYPGKSGVERQIHISDARLVALLEQMDPTTMLGAGEEPHLFVVHDGEKVVRLSAANANDMLSELSAGTLTCKDFRTWGGSSVALAARVEGADEVAAVDAASEALGNTRAVARAAYVHPTVLEAPDEVVQTAWSAARSSIRYDRREQALNKLLQETPPVLQQWVQAQEAGWLAAMARPVDATAA